MLDRELPELRVEEVAGAAEFATALRVAPLDLVITELELAWAGGLEVAEAADAARPGVPVVAFTAAGELERAVEAFKAGFVDFVRKDSRGYLSLAASVAEALDRAKTERLVARSEPWLQTLLDQANVGVFRCTPDGRLIEANVALLRLLRVGSVEEVLELELPLHYLQSAAGVDLARQMSEGGELQARTVEVTRPDGTTVWLNLNEIMLLDVDGDIVVDVLVQDVSHLKGHEFELEHRLAVVEQSHRELTEFTSMAAHELKAPLRMLEKYGEVLTEELPDRLNDEARTALGFLQDGASRMRTMVDDLLKFSRINGVGLEPAACDVNEIVDGVLGVLQPAIEESGAGIERDDLPTVVADAADLGQVFQNLIANAIKFRGDKKPEIRIGGSEEEESWVLWVRDNGIGIDPREADGVFTLFRRLHPEYEGTGIGLAICKRLVERQGGSIRVESQPGEGSTFYVSIPRHATSGSAPPANGPESEPGA